MSLILQNYQNQTCEGPQTHKRLTLSKIKFWPKNQILHWKMSKKQFKISKVLDSSPIRSMFKNWQHQKIMFFQIWFQKLNFLKTPEPQLHYQVVHNGKQGHTKKELFIDDKRVGDGAEAKNIDSRNGIFQTKMALFSSMRWCWGLQWL